MIYLLTFLLPLTLSGPGGGTNHPPPSFEKCHSFRKANDIDLKFYDKRYMIKKNLSGILLISALFSDAPVSTQKKWFYFVHVTGAVLTYYLSKSSL